jgi:hypothetical protein
MTPHHGLARQRRNNVPYSNCIGRIGVTKRRTSKCLQPAIPSIAASNKTQPKKEPKPFVQEPNQQQLPKKPEPR